MNQQLEFVGELNRLAGTTGREAAGAANIYAGTTNLELIGALNAKAGTTGLELDHVCNVIAGTTGLSAAGALATISPVTLAKVEPVKDQNLNYLLDESSTPIYEEN